MTLDELRERIKNELVLQEGNVADWQWARTGLPTEAGELGITDFLRLVDDVSRPLNAQFGKILDLQAFIQKTAIDNHKQLSDVQVGGFALDAERLGLSRAFVTEQWVPKLVAKLPNAAPPKPAEELVPPPADKELVSLTETVETMQQKVRDILDDYKEHIPAPAIRALFRAINYDEQALSDAVLAYLTTHFYASEKEPQGSTLREKLTSTDWRHLVWWDRPTEPATTPVSGNTPPDILPPVVVKSSSGWRDFLVALLIAGGLIGFVVLLIRSNGAGKPNEEKHSPETQVDSAVSTERSAPGKLKRKRSRRNGVRTDRPRLAETEATETAPVRETPYDELRSDVGQYGDRAARKNGQWGLWRNRKWMIRPAYDDIQVYRNNRARVTINGNGYDIDRNGDRIR